MAWLLASATLLLQFAGVQVGFLQAATMRCPDAPRSTSSMKVAVNFSSLRKLCYRNGGCGHCQLAAARYEW